MSQKEEKEIWRLGETEKVVVRDFIRVVREELMKGDVDRLSIPERKIQA